MMMIMMSETSQIREGVDTSVHNVKWNVPDHRVPVGTGESVSLATLFKALFTCIKIGDYILVVKPSLPCLPVVFLGVS